MRPLVIALAITLGLASSVLASDKTKDKKDTKAKKPKQEQETNQERVVLTGSYIKQDIRRSGRITDGPNQVVVLDRDAIERSGAADLKQLLIRQGIH